MKRKNYQIIVTSFVMVVLVTLLSYCSSDSELKPATFKKITQEEIKLKDKFVADFSEKYSAFINSLSVAQKEDLANYIETLEMSIAAAKTNNMEVKCNCGPNMSTCSASGVFSECCICWNPLTQTGACGVFWGVAVCKNETNPTPPQVNAQNNYVKLYPARFSEMLEYVRSKGTDINLIKSELDNLIKHAE